MSIDSISASKLEKTSSHAFAETDELLQSAIDKASEAKNAGSNRTRGYASLIVLAAGLLFQSGGILALGKLAPSNGPVAIDMQKTDVSAPQFSIAESNLIDANLGRIRANTKAIQEMKDRVAPSMPINSSLAAIDAAVQDLETVVLGQSTSVRGE